MRQRVLWGDVLRTIATILVVLIHAIAPYQYATFNNHDKLSFLSLATINSITRMAVPAFFMLTGAFLLNRTSSTITKSSYLKWIKKTTVRLIIPFLIFSAIGYIYSRLSNNLQPTFLNFMANLFNYPGVQYHMWFMYSIILIYLFIPFLQKFISSLRRSELKILVVVIFLCGNLLRTINLISNNYDKTLFSGISFSDLIICTNYLFIGHYLSKYEISKKQYTVILIAGIVSLIALPLTMLFMNTAESADSLSSVTQLSPFFIGIAGFVSIKRYCENHSFSKRTHAIITRFSSISFYVYMIHVVILDAIQRYHPVNTTSLAHYISSIIAQSLITLLISTVIAIVFNLIYTRSLSLLNTIRRQLTKNLQPSQAEDTVSAN